VIALSNITLAAAGLAGLLAIGLASRGWWLAALPCAASCALGVTVALFARGR